MTLHSHGAVDSPASRAGATAAGFVISSAQADTLDETLKNNVLRVGIHPELTALLLAQRSPETSRVSTSPSPTSWRKS